MPDSIVIGGQPIAFDYQCKLREFLRDRLPPEEVLFARWVPAPKMHAAVVESYEAFTPPYPPLPPIEIGELQWPSGASRYARALYVVDRHTLLLIAQAAWGLDISTLTDADLADVLESWGTDSINGVVVSIYGEEFFEALMLPLPPYRIPGTGTDLFLLPLVDNRFLRQNIPYEETTVPTTWASMLTALGNALQLPISLSGTISANYGKPDPLTIKPGIAAAALLDCVALSLGRRIVIDPGTDVLRMIDAADSDTRCEATIAKTSIIAGGFRGKAVVPSGLTLFCRKSNQYSLECGYQEKRSALLAGATATYTQLAHSAWVVEERLFSSVIQIANGSESNTYAQQVLDDMETWYNSGGQYAFAGAIRYTPSGYDDYLTIKAAEVAPNEYWFATRIYELPAVFLPNLLLNQYESLRYAALVETWVAKDQELYPGEAYYPGIPTAEIQITNLETSDTGKTVTAFYRCGIGWTKISVGTSGAELYSFTLTADLAGTVGATATATATAASDGSSAGVITVTSPGFRTFAGATGVAAKVADGVYWVLVVDQPALRVRVVLDAHPNNGTGSEMLRRFGADPREVNAAIKTGSIDVPVALTPFPFSFMRDFSSGLVPNPRELFGENGDTAVIAWDADTDAYFLEEVFPQRQQEVWAALTAARPAGLAQAMTADPMTPASDGNMPAAGFAVDDTYNVAINAKIGDRILARWDAYAAKYKAITAEHTTRRVQGYLTTSFTGSPATFFVTVEKSMDGKTPADASIEVENRFGWVYGFGSDKVEVEWDTIGGVWYGVQMKRRATRCKALLYAAFSSAPATAQVDNVVGLDGYAPAYTTSMTVTNRFNWDSGADNADVEIVWDSAANVWYLNQMDCPP